MRKVLLLILALGIMVGAQAQNKAAFKDLRKATSRNLSAKIDVKEFANIPFKPRNNYGTKAMEWVAIGTSVNIYSVLVDAQNYLDANPETNSVMFTHRMGGAWGGSGADIKCKFTTDFGATWDSITYVNDGANLHRYPSGVIYNPWGNTDINNASSVIVGPCTNGSGWVSNFYHSQQLNGTNDSRRYVTQELDTFAAHRTNLTSGNGHFHVCSPVMLDGGNEYLYYQIDNGVFDTDSNKVDWTTNYIKPLFKKRVFSNATVNWDANASIAFGDDGIHGYFFTFGCDSLVDPDHTSIPLVWETFDAGATWAQTPVYNGFSDICALKDQIWGTYASMAAYPTNPENWVFRADFRSGASGDEGNFPGVVDAYGNLHFACVVEGRYSDNVDSLDYTFANHPSLLFDVYTSTGGTKWDAIFIDTLRTDVVLAENSGFGTGTNAVGWDNMLRMTKSPDGTKVFVSWTDTDVNIDTVNVMPEIKAWGVDLATNKMTPPTLFESGNGNIFFYQTSDVCLKEGTTYKIPATYVDIYESSQNPDNPQKHYFMKGIEFDETAFTDTVPTTFYTCPATSSQSATQNNNFVAQNYPNPAQNNTMIKVNVKESTDINIVVTNVLGQKVYETTKNNAGAGAHNFTINTNWGHGVYFYTVTAGTLKSTKKMLVD